MTMKKNRIYIEIYPRCSLYAWDIPHYNLPVGHGIIFQKQHAHRGTRMEIAVALLLNIVYGLLFFLAFGVLVLTIIYFSMALWENFGKKLFKAK
jgi:hypothetical protein